MGTVIDCSLFSNIFQTTDTNPSNNMEPCMIKRHKEYTFTKDGLE